MNMPSVVLRKKSRRMRMDCSSNDRISQLPDELLLTILSLLTIKDAVVACMVSPRWRNLWMDNIGCWNLEIPKKTKVRVVRGYRHTKALRQTERVNKALELHSGPYLEELRIGAYRGSCLPTQVHSWVNFAIQKGVKIFELKFDTDGINPWYQHSFPSVDNFAKLLDDKTSERWLHHPCRMHPEKHQFRSFCCLKSLSLGYLNVSEEIVNYFLLNCMFLERLRVEFSKTLLNLEVPDGLRLKCLEIIRCLNIRSLKIYARNLESLVFIGPKIDMPFQNAPLNRLELTIRDQFGESFAFEHGKHRIYLSQLETLKFAVSCKVHTFFCRDPCEFPKMINLRHLELQVPIGKSLLGYMTFFIASPFLSTFKMEYRLRRSFIETEAERLERENYDKRHEARSVTHQHLQKVELIGFHNDLTDIHFAMHLINMAVRLKKMVLKFRQQSANQTAFSVVRKKLGEILPAGAELLLMKA